MENRCVCCGEIIPEGRMVCPLCEWKADEQSKANEVIKDEKTKSKK